MATTLTFEDFKSRYGEIAAGIETGALSKFILVHEHPVEIEGDYSIDPTHSAPDTPWCHVFLSDLTIRGNLLNTDGCGGKTLFVNGTTTADNIVAGGSFIYLNEAIVAGIVFGHYNDGMIQIKSLKGELVISHGHHMHTRFSDRTKGISMSDYPNSGFNLLVDSIRPDLGWSEIDDLQARTFLDFFADLKWLELWTDSKDPKVIANALEDREFSMLWLEWVNHVLEKGRGESVAEFQRLIAHFRNAYTGLPRKPE